LRVAGDEALRVTCGATGIRGDATAAGVELAGVARPCSTRISFSFMDDEAAGEFVFTKRCSLGSYAMEESLPREPVLVPDLLSTTVLETRVGGAVATRPPLRLSRGGDFNTSHFCPCSTGISSEVPPLVPTFEKTPRSKFKGVFPFSSSGCIGTMPLFAPCRTKTAVTG